MVFGSVWPVLGWAGLFAFLCELEGGVGEGICVGTPSAMSSAVSGEQGVDGGRRSKLRGRWRFYWGVLGCITPAVCRIAPGRTACMRFRFCSAGVGNGRSWRFCWGALRSDHACCLPHSAKQDGLREVPFLFCAGRDRHSCVLAAAWGYLALLVHFGIVCFLWRSRRSSTGVRLYEKKRRIGWALLSLWCADSL